MEEYEYRTLVRERDSIKEMLGQKMSSNLRTSLENKLSLIRQQIKEAHEGHYRDNNRTLSN